MAVTTYKYKSESNNVKNEENQMIFPVFPVIPKG